MKLTKPQLKQLIQEELLKEQFAANLYKAFKKDPAYRRLFEALSAWLKKSPRATSAFKQYVNILFDYNVLDRRNFGIGTGEEAQPLDENKNKCGEKPKWDPKAQGAELKDMRAFYNCWKRGRALPDGYPFSETNKQLVTPDLAQDPTGGAAHPPLGKTEAWNEQFKSQIFKLTRMSKNPIANMLQISQLFIKYQRVLKPEMVQAVSKIVNEALRELGLAVSPDVDVKSLKGGDVFPPSAEEKIKAAEERFRPTEPKSP